MPKLQTGMHYNTTLTFLSLPFDTVAVLCTQLRSRLLCMCSNNLVIVLRQITPLSMSFSFSRIFYNNHYDGHYTQVPSFTVSLKCRSEIYTTYNCKDCHLADPQKPRFSRRFFPGLWYFRILLCALTLLVGSHC